MKEKPILFSTEMVKAILAGRKTQTRRKADMTSRHIRKLFDGAFEGESGRIYHSPYGQVGDVLWVRETCGQGVSGKYYYKTKNDMVTDELAEQLVIRWKPSIHMPKDAARIWLRITNVRVERLQDISEEDAIKEGVERVADFGSTGYKLYTEPNAAHSDIDAVWSFESLWKSINGEESWNSNPWVWVIEFEKIEKP